MRESNAHQFLFYAPLLGESSGWVELDGEELHHLSRVLRMNPGETAWATNGKGVLARCRLDHVSRTAARLAVLETRTSVPGRRVTLALALLRKDAFERAVEQCTELGIAACVPFVSQRSHVQRYSQEFLSRLRRISLAAMKQSFRPFLPDLGDVIGFDALASRLRDCPCAFLGDSDGGPPDFGAAPSDLWIVVGPEGGLSEIERGRLEEAGVRPVRVSGSRLRSETAAVSLVAVSLAAPEGTRQSSVD